MFTLKHVFVFFILQITVSLFCLAYPDSFESTNTEEDDSYEENEYPIKICPEEEMSLISHTDIKYLIENNADILKIKEHFVNIYYSAAEEIFKLYMGELEEFQEIFYDRPEHMLHILHDMARVRQELEPQVEEIATLLETIYIIEDNINDAIKESGIMLNQLEKYKSMCKINCEEIENSFRHKIDNNPLIVPQSHGMSCVRIKDLNDQINKTLSEVQAQYDEGLNQQLQIINNMYAQNFTELKINLKEAAVKQFGMTMYDILSLQDDYHHFVKDLKHFNISSEKFNIMENSAEISFRVLGLHRDLEKYRQYCMKCNMNQRVKRDVLDLLDDKLDDVEESFVIPKENTRDAKTFNLDELIKVTIDEIRESIRSNITSMFEELDQKLSDPDVIDIFVSNLHPIQSEIGYVIQMEQEALRILSSRIPEASIDKIFALSKESQQIIQNLESAKQFIDQFIS